MTKNEAIDWVVNTKKISPFTRNFVEWLYDKHGGFIGNKEDCDKINGMTILAELHGQKTFKEIKRGR
jgi:hypothetical protein